MLPRKLSGDDRKPKGIIPYVDKINMQQRSLVDRRCNGRAWNGNGIQGTRGGRGRELGSGDGRGRGGGAVEGQGAVEDATFRDSDGGATRAGLSAMRMEMRGLG
jgi:hypothetical protein